MAHLFCFIILIIFLSVSYAIESEAPQGKAIANKSLEATFRNGTVENGTSTVNSTHIAIPSLIMLSVEIIKKGNRSNNTEKARDGSEIFVLDGKTPEKISFFQPPKASPYFPRFSEISMRTLYLIVCMCLLILLLMIVKLLVSRKERKKDYDMVTKGEFDA